MVSSNEKQIIGIYKITSPSGKIYIGQSVDIHKRFRNYKTLNNCKQQTRLYNSLIKHGSLSHSYEIIETTDFELLNFKERYWQDFYEVLGKTGLNCHLQKTETKKRIDSEETKIRKKQGSKNRPPISEITREKRSIALKGRIVSEETRKKLSEKLKGNKNGNYGVTSSRKGTTLNQEQKDKLKNSARKGHENHKSKIVLDTQNGVFYESAQEVADLYKIHAPTLRKKLNGRLTNKTFFKYV